MVNLFCRNYRKIRRKVYARHLTRLARVHLRWTRTRVGYRGVREFDQTVREIETVMNTDYDGGLKEIRMEK